MIAYTGIETVSNLAEEARDPVRTVPARTLYAVAVFAIYFTLPLDRALGAPRGGDRRRVETKLALPPEEGGFANDPILGVVKNLGIEGSGSTPPRSTSASSPPPSSSSPRTPASSGPRGSRTRWPATASYPRRFRRLHPRFKTPWLSLVVFAGYRPILMLLPGQVDFLGTMYSFGATLSFTIAHVSLVVLRYRGRDERARIPGPPEPPAVRRRLAALRAARRARTGARSSSLVVQNAGDPLGGARLDRHRVRDLRRLSAARRARAAAGDRQGTARIRPCSRTRVSAAARPRRPPASPRTTRWTSPAGSQRSAGRASSR